MVCYFSLTMNPSLSIITINFNNRVGLQKTIESVVCQRFTYYEWIVIDGGSTDGSIELIEQYAEHFSFWVSETDKGIYNAMNKGIEKAKGDYLLFLNSGDSLCDEGVIEDFYKLNPNSDIVSGNIITDDSIYNIRFSPEEQELSYKYLCESTILHPSSFIKRELFLKYGGYDESLKIVSDWKFFFICLIQHSCSYQKWERCVTNFSTDGISENPQYSTLLESERKKVITEVLPYVNRTYLDMTKQIASLRDTLNMTQSDRIYRFLQKGIRKLSSIACVTYLRFRHAWSGFRSNKRTDERVIISMTTWSKRICNVPIVIESILKNSLKPDIIVLNLSEEEFPQKELELPEYITELVRNKTIEIIWTPGDLKAFKKFIPTLKKYPNDVILAIDDDFIYPKDFIETFIEEHKHSPDTPLSGNFFKVNGVNGHCGCASLVKAEYYGPFIDTLIDNKVLELRMDDIFYVFCAAMNNVHYKYVGKLFYTNMRPISGAEGISANGRDEANKAMTDYLVTKIRGNYHIDMTKIHKPFFTV